MLEQFINKYKDKLDTVSISETLELFYFKITSRCDLLNILDFTNDLIGALEKIPSRDTFEVQHEISGNSITIQDLSKSKRDEVKAHLNESLDEEDSNYDICLTINKNCDKSRISFYSTEQFHKYIDNQPKINILKSISKKMGENLILEFYDEIDAFYSRTILACKAEELSKFINKVKSIDRNEKRLDIHDNCSIINFSSNLLPDDFNLLLPSKYDNINNAFNMLCAALSLICISNITHVSRDDKIELCKINGYKTIVLEDIHFNELLKHFPFIFKIYEWSYNDSRAADKLGLVRNILSIQVGSNGELAINKETWDALRSNYQIYLKNNIEKYLSLKNKIVEFIIGETSKTFSMANELLDSLKKNTIILLTFLLTSVVINGFNNLSGTFFSPSYLFIVIILIVISFIWMILTRYDILSRYKKANSIIRDSIFLSYDKLLINSEIENTITPLLEKNKNFLEERLCIYTSYWSGIIIVFLVLYLSAYFIIPISKESNVPIEKTKIESPAKLIPNTTSATPTISTNEDHDLQDNSRFKTKSLKTNKGE